MSSLSNESRTSVVAPALVGGDVALDLANTISSRGTPREADHIGTFDMLLDWCVRAGSLGPAEAVIARRSARRDRRDAERVLADAGRLRGAVFEIGSAIAAGGMPSEHALATLHGLAHATLGAGRLAPNGRAVDLDFRGGGLKAAIVGPLAWAAVSLFAGDRVNRLKQCLPDDCRWLFLDQTKNGSRRWCDMATCGNREKAARHRKR